MKKLLLLSVAVISMLFNTACSGDEDSISDDSSSVDSNTEDSSSDDSIIGSWQLESFFLNGEDDTFECETMNTITFTSTEITEIMFESINGECVANGPYTSSYSIEGNVITTDNDSGTEFSLQGDTLIFNPEEIDGITVATFKRI